MNYSEDEVAALILWWSELRHSGHLWVLVRYADLSRAIGMLPPKENMAVLLMGLLRLTTRDAADVMGVHNTTAADRYHSGIRLLTHYINGGEPL